MISIHNHCISHLRFHAKKRTERFFFYFLVKQLYHRCYHSSELSPYSHNELILFLNKSLKRLDLLIATTTLFNVTCIFSNPRQSVQFAYTYVHSLQTSQVRFFISTQRSIQSRAINFICFRIISLLDWKVFAIRIDQVIKSDDQILCGFKRYGRLQDRYTVVNWPLNYRNRPYGTEMGICKYVNSDEYAI